MSEDYIYAVTRVHARETGLLGKNDLERLLACPDEKACLQVLRRTRAGARGEPPPPPRGCWPPRRQRPGTSCRRWPKTLPPWRRCWCPSTATT